MTHDVCGPGTFGIFQKEFGANAQVCVMGVMGVTCVPRVLIVFAQDSPHHLFFSALPPSLHKPHIPRPKQSQVWDNERVVIIPDHYIFTADPRANRNVDILRCVGCVCLCGAGG